MTYPCEIIRDLIPLVNDDVAREKSKEAVTEHLSHCDECRQYAKQCQESLYIPFVDTEDVEKVASAKSYAKRIKRRYFIITVAAVSVSVAIFLVLFSISSWFGFEGYKYSTTDIREYGQYDGHISQEWNALSGRTRLVLFPEEITENHNVESYFYECNEAGLDNTYMLFLDYTLTPAAFEEELERISNISMTYKGQTNTLIYDEENFKYPAFVAAFRRGRNNDEFGVFEYALVDEENYRIICVLVSENYLSMLPIEEELKPPTDLNYVNNILGFSVYAFPIEGGVVIPGEEELE